MTLGKMVETALWSLNLSPNSITNRMAETALRAVIEKHIGPMIEDAARFGFRLDEGQEISEVAEGIRLYRARIISDLTANPPAPEKERT